MPRQVTPAASSPSKLALEGRCDPCPSRSALRIPVAFAVLAPAATLPRFRKLSTVPAPPRLAEATESVSHPGSFRPSPAPVAARTLQTASPPAPLLPSARPVPVAPAAASLEGVTKLYIQTISIRGQSFKAF